MRGWESNPKLMLPWDRLHMSALRQHPFLQAGHHLNSFLSFQESCWYGSEQMPLNQPPRLLLLLHNPSGMHVHTRAGLPVFGQSVEETIKDNRYLR